MEKRLDYIWGQAGTCIFVAAGVSTQPPSRRRRRRRRPASRAPALVGSGAVLLLQPPDTATIAPPSPTASPAPETKPNTPSTLRRGAAAAPHGDSQSCRRPLPMPPSASPAAAVTDSRTSHQPIAAGTHAAAVLPPPPPPPASKPSTSPGRIWRRAAAPAASHRHHLLLLRPPPALPPTLNRTHPAQHSQTRTRREKAIEQSGSRRHQAAAGAEVMWPHRRCLVRPLVAAHASTHLGGCCNISQPCNISCPPAGRPARSQTAVVPALPPATRPSARAASPWPASASLRPTLQPASCSASHPPHPLL